LAQNLTGGGKLLQSVDNAKKLSLSQRDAKITRLYEQGASKWTIWQYLRRWLGGACVSVGLCGVVAFPSYVAAIQAADGTAHFAWLNPITAGGNTGNDCVFGSTASAGDYGGGSWVSRYAPGNGTTDSGAEVSSGDGLFTSNVVHADTDGWYAYRDTQGYCWECQYNATTKSYTDVREATDDKYYASCANVNIACNTYHVDDDGHRSATCPSSSAGGTASCGTNVCACDNNNFGFLLSSTRSYDVSSGTSNGTFSGQAVGYCSSNSDTTCTDPAPTTLSDGTYYFKNAGDSAQYYQCDWVTGTGFTSPSTRITLAPGGISSELQLWLKADNGVTPSTDGSAVTTWTDQSPNGYNAQPGTADVHSSPDTSPLYHDNSSNNINFNPAVTFADGNGLTLGSNYIFADNSKSGVTIFAVGQHDGTGANSDVDYLFDFGFSGNDGYGLGISNTQTVLYVAQAHGGAALSNSHSFATTPILLTGHIEFGSAVTQYLNATQFETAPITTTQLTTTEIGESTTHQDSSPTGGPVSIGRQAKGTTSRYFNGQITEVVVYTSAVSAGERQKIESYLAVKYGITKSDNYATSDNTVVWTSGNGYDNDIAGIGRDNASTLDQRKSKSVNSDALITMDNGGAFSADQSFLV
jgi:hypothetical protein